MLLFKCTLRPENMVWGAKSVIVCELPQRRQSQVERLRAVAFGC